MFLGGKERDQWYEIGEVECKLNKSLCLISKDSSYYNLVSKTHIPFTGILWLISSMRLDGRKVMNLLCQPNNFCVH